MENREAIHKLIMFRRILERGVFPLGYRFDAEPFDLAISALEKQEQGDWIPCAERLPEEYGEYRITWKTSSDPGKRFIGDAEYEPGFEWDDAHDRFFGEWLLEDYVKAYPDVEVTAWKPIGEPYTEEEA